MIADEIEKKNKVPEKSSPAPSKYNHHLSRDYCKKRSASFAVPNQERVSFSIEAAVFAAETPGCKIDQPKVSV